MALFKSIQLSTAFTHAVCFLGAVKASVLNNCKRLQHQTSFVRDSIEQHFAKTFQQTHKAQSMKDYIVERIYEEQAYLIAALALTSRKQITLMQSEHMFYKELSAQHPRQMKIYDVLNLTYKFEDPHEMIGKLKNYLFSLLETISTWHLPNQQEPTPDDCILLPTAAADSKRARSFDEGLYGRWVAPRYRQTEGRTPLEGERGGEEETREASRDVERCSNGKMFSFSDERLEYGEVLAGGRMDRVGLTRSKLRVNSGTITPASRRISSSSSGCEGDLILDVGFGQSDGSMPGGLMLDQVGGATGESKMVVYVISSGLLTSLLLICARFMRLPLV